MEWGEIMQIHKASKSKDKSKSLIHVWLNHILLQETKWEAPAKITRIKYKQYNETIERPLRGKKKASLRCPYCGTMIWVVVWSKKKCTRLALRGFAAIVAAVSFIVLLQYFGIDIGPESTWWEVALIIFFVVVTIVGIFIIGWTAKRGIFHKGIVSELRSEDLKNIIPHHSLCILWGELFGKTWYHNN